jgi:preprotein translocase subunit SecG
MIAALTVLHILVCFVLIAVVLLQRGKGAEMGAVFGGGASATVFGSRGAGTFLGKLTTGCAVIFMLTGERLFEGGVAEESAAEDSPFEQLGTVMPEEPAEAAGEATPDAPE